MGKIIWMTPPTLIAYFAISDIFKKYHGHTIDLLFGLIVMGSVVSIIWFVAYRLFTMK
mgnify:FL=1|jgi:hypothetical protein